MLKLVTTTGRPSRHGGIEVVLEAIKAAGFDGVDLGFFELGDEWATDTAGFLAKVRAAGLPVCQAHAPFPGRRWGDPDFDAVHDPAVRHSMRVAAEAGAPVIVVHPIYCPALTAAEQREWNLDYYNSLAPLARELGIKIALENMWSATRPDHFTPNVCSLPEDFSRYYDALDPAVFTCCLDLGHFAMLGCSPAKAIREMGHERVGVLHVHDNDCVHDQHTVPFFGEIDWDDVVRALVDIDYRGYFTFEADRITYLPTPLLRAGENLLCETGRLLLRKMEEYRTGKK